MSTSELPDWKELNTAERLSIVTPLWMGGSSAGDIAFLFRNATRSAVIGLVHRAKLGRAAKKALPNPKKPVRQTPQARIPRPPKPVQMRPLLPGPQAEPPPPRDETVFDHVHQNRPPLPLADRVGPTRPVPLLALPNREKGVCRFPVIGGFCGQPCGDDVSVCTGHEVYFYAPEGLERIRKRRAANARG